MFQLVMHYVQLGERKHHQLAKVYILVDTVTESATQIGHNRMT